MAIIISIAIIVILVLAGFAIHFFIDPFNFFEGFGIGLKISIGLAVFIGIAVFVGFSVKSVAWC